MTPIEAAAAEVDRLEVECRSYERDPWRDVPAELRARLHAAEERLRQLCTRKDGDEHAAKSEPVAFDAGLIIARAPERRMLKDLRPGALFEIESGDYGVKRDVPVEHGEVWVVWLATGRLGTMPAHAMVEEVLMHAHEWSKVQRSTDMSIEAIRARHDAVYSRGWLEAHADRGELLAVIAAMRKAPAAQPEKAALAVGVRVRAKHNPERDREYDPDGIIGRNHHNGQAGTIREMGTGHGICWRVDHGNGDAWWEPDELTPEPAVFQSNVDRYKRSAKKPAATQRPRPRVGPWVAEGGCRSRYDDRGEEVATLWPIDGEWGGWARRSFAPPGRFDCDTEEKASAAVDAVLREWADLDGEPAQDQESEPPTSDPHDHWVAWRGSVSDLVTDLRATVPKDKIGQLVRELAPARMWTEEQLCAAFGQYLSEGTIRACLTAKEPQYKVYEAASPITGGPLQRLWTEQQIKEAWCRAQETSRPEWMPARSTSDLENEWTHVQIALRGKEGRID